MVREASALSTGQFSPEEFSPLSSCRALQPSLVERLPKGNSLSGDVRNAAEIWGKIRTELLKNQWHSTVRRHHRRGVEKSQRSGLWWRYPALFLASVLR